VTRPPKALRAIRTFAREVLQGLWLRDEPHQAAGRPGSPKRVRELLARAEKLLHKVAATSARMHAVLLQYTPNRRPTTRLRSLSLTTASLKALPLCCLLASGAALTACRLLSRSSA
jgi:hypothetical protein